MTDLKTNQAADLMESFAARTGLTGPAPPRRYLWTDAFAVCNFIALRRTTGDARYADLVSQLVAQVHDVLAPRRDPEHPTIAGLRIGKPFPERAIGEPYDANLEWDRDGQYFHYLTKWMLALDQLARDLRQPKLIVWACELAQTAQRAFTYGASGERRMFWKMSVDLSRPQVESMGQHDPLDGFVTCLGLVATAARWQPPVKCPDLAGAIADFASMIEPRVLATADPLGIGGLLIDARRLQQQLEEMRLIRIIDVCSTRCWPPPSSACGASSRSRICVSPRTVDWVFASWDWRLVSRPCRGSAPRRSSATHPCRTRSRTSGSIRNRARRRCGVSIKTSTR
jgi:hypothetical protein